MNIEKNARLTPLGREAIVCEMAAGQACGFGGSSLCWQLPTPHT
jgi:hypothetical protein